MTYAPIYVIAGKEDSIVNAEAELLLEKLLEPQQRAVGLFRAEPAEVSITDVLDELRTAPFLTARRVVLVKNADKFVSENRRLLEMYFDNPCPTGILILTVKSWPAQTKLAKKLHNIGKLISVTPPKSWQLPPRLALHPCARKALNNPPPRLPIPRHLRVPNLVERRSNLPRQSLAIAGQNFLLRPILLHSLRVPDEHQRRLHPPHLPQEAL